MPKNFDFKNIIIKNVKKEDLKACATISIKSWQATYKNIVDKEYLVNLSIQKRLEKFESNYKLCPFLVAKINNEVVGFCRYSTNVTYEEYPEIDSELTVLYVSPELKHHGIGTALFNYVKTELQKENKKNMLICCLKGNTLGENFYQKMQGQIIGETTIKIGDKLYSEISFKFQI